MKPSSDVVPALAGPLGSVAWPRLRAQLLRLRWPGGVGAGLTAAGLALALVTVPALERERDELLARAEQVRASAARDALRSAPPRQDAARAYRDALPDERSRQRRIAALMRQAAGQALQPRRTEFQYDAAMAPGLAQYRVTMPVEGSYGAVRTLVERALRDDPALSLDRLRLRRAAEQQAHVQAELVWTLHMRTALPGGEAPTKHRGTP